MLIQTMQITMHDTVNQDMRDDNAMHVIIKNYFETNERKLWHIFPIDMGCMIVAKHDGTHSNQPIHIFFMHSDMWGQYGDEHSSIPDLIEFVPDDYVCGSGCEETEDFIKNKRRGYADASAIKVIKCPTCRKISEWDSRATPIRFQTAADEEIPKCIICCVNEVSIILNECGHCILCNECALRL
jgi:hypothetical protein